MRLASALIGAGDAPVEGAVAGSALWAVARRLGRGPAEVVVADGAALARTVRALRFWLPGVGVRPYPADDGEPWDGAPRDPDRARDRVLARADRAAIVVVEVAALARKVPRLEPWVLRRGDRVDPQALARWLLARGYLATQRVDAPGCVALRGGSMAVWPVGAEHPTRIDWFDDEIEAPKGPLVLLPAREAPLDAASAERAAAYVHAVAGERGVVGSERRRLLADLREGVWFAGADDYLPALTDLEAYTPRKPRFLVEPERLADALRRAEDARDDAFDALEPEDRPLVRPSDLYLRADDVDLRGIEVRAGGGRAFAEANTALRVGGGDVVPVAKRLRAAAADGAAVTVVVDDAVRADRVRALFAGHGLRFGDGPARAGELALVVGDLPEGFSADDFVFVTADEVFGDKLRASAPAQVSSATRFRQAVLQGLAKLRRGDFIVHARHGIGQYRGLARMPMGEVEGDFVIVEYRGGDKLYVPVARLDLVTPYTAATGVEPRLDKLGGSTWELRTAKVKDELLKFAAELLRLHARRAVARAKTYDGRDGLLAQFEETFPFVETPDQRSAVDAILEDLAAGAPMDRLVVGDVGFGKTEVAMRAAFRVVEDGDQVVVLCPTTVLAAQHHATFARRFADFPVRIDHLSRFRTAADGKRVLDDLANGRVDIVIGTHKLLTKGIRFARLGLVVVDEEHRFGVKQKEELRRLTAGVHTLAMSATPIPRTLHLALAGLRAMSVIATPPEGREPIRTDVVRFSAERVRADVEAELARDGQVFFVHNRVQSIAGVARWLRQQLPGVRIGVAHGQMDGDTLEEVLTQFAHRELDVLVSTAIIESGIDMPTVNTMIVNRAETFGLAQLYQLRGRIGRGSVRGHCTLLVSGAGTVRREAMERLRALQAHTALGSGFALASEDLELRGGGEILGEKQWGHVAAIGFDAYVQLLEEAVHAVRGDATRAHIEPELELPVVAVIPEAWMPDPAERLDAYGRLAQAHDAATLDRTAAALASAWGPLPEETQNLVEVLRIKLRCRDVGIAHLLVHTVSARATLHPQARVPASRIDELCKAAPNRFRRTPAGALEARFTMDEGRFPLHVATWLVDRLAGAPGT